MVSKFAAVESIICTTAPQIQPYKSNVTFIMHTYQILQIHLKNAEYWYPASSSNHTNILKWILDSYTSVSCIHYYIFYTFSKQKTGTGQFTVQKMIKAWKDDSEASSSLIQVVSCILCSVLPSMGCHFRPLSLWCFIEAESQGAILQMSKY